MRKILIVEPNLGAGMEYFRAFAVAGYFAEHVTGGAKALAALDQLKPDAVALHLLLRDNQASTLLEAIRSRSKTRTLPVVVFAPESAAYLFGKARSEGATECVNVGPGGPEALVSAVQRTVPLPAKSQATVAQNAVSVAAPPLSRLATPVPEPPLKPAPPARETSSARARDTRAKPSVSEPEDELDATPSPLIPTAIELSPDPLPFRPPLALAPAHTLDLLRAGRGAHATGNETSGNTSKPRFVQW